MSTIPLTVENVLKIDKESRVPGIKGDLFTLEEVMKEVINLSAIDVPEGYIYFKREKEEPREIAKSYNEFMERIPNRVIKTILDIPNVVIAGGFVSKLLMKKVPDLSDSDIDIFVYNLNEVQAEEKFYEIIKKLKETENSSLHSIHRFPNVTNLYYGTRKIQIIHKLYNSISEILHGFDMGSCTFAFDNKTVYFTTLSKFAALYRCNIVDLSKKSPSYEYRLKKYFDRGFDMMIPNLDSKKVFDTKHIKNGLYDIMELHNMEITYKKCTYRSVSVKEIKCNYVGRDHNYENHEDGEEVGIINIAATSSDGYFDTYRNVKKLLNGDTKLSYINSIENPNDKKVFLNEESIKKHYEEFKRRLLKKLKNDDLNIRFIENHIKCEDIKIIAIKLLFEKETREKYVEELIEKQVNLLISLLASTTIEEIQWLPYTDERLQSFEHQEITYKEWCGKYYKE